MLKLYNTLTKKVEEFVPINKESVRLYACGPTVYDFAHIGNLRTYIFEDILHRVLQYNDFVVNHAMNITDVGHLVGDGDEGEDKMEVGAKREGVSPLDVAKKYEVKFFEDLAELNIIKPNQTLRATESIADQIDIIKILLDKGFAYKGEQAIFFDTSKFPYYGKLSGQKLSDKKTGAREDIVVDKDKKNPSDFALWFFLVGRYKNHILHWASPWGEGFPGWHIECSAISRKLLGQPFDIHTGGVDHIGTHHTNEIAQSEAAFEIPLANVWMHGEFLVTPQLKCESCGYMFSKPLNIIKVEIAQVKDEFGKCPKCGELNNLKMGKSSGNFIKLDTLKEKGFSPLDYRYMCLQAHYRTQLNFTLDNLKATSVARSRLVGFVMTETLSSFVNTEYKSKFLNAINDDLDIPKALAIAWNLLSDSKVNDPEKKATLLDFDKVLGIGLSVAQEMYPVQVGSLLDFRKKAKDKKDFVKSDELRKEIENLGYEVMDTPEGQKVKKKINL